VDRAEDRRLPRPARESGARRSGGARARARLLQLPRVVRTPPRGARRARGRARRVGAALRRAEENAARNGFANFETREANAFDYLRDAERAGERFDTIVLDPPAFAKTRAALPAALRGYKEVNLRAMRLLAPGGLLFTASCSYHLTKPLFLEMLADAAADSGRRIALREVRGQPLDHPELLTVPETGYIKGALLEAMD
jgi:23S rRNA (cytosine1962-C5)-methyltransferase